MATYKQWYDCSLRRFSIYKDKAAPPTKKNHQNTIHNKILMAEKEMEK